MREDNSTSSTGGRMNEGYAVAKLAEFERWHL
jgi:hypothetical protein